jgi:hypothetical protein
VELADINGGLRARPNDSALEKIVEKYPLPENCTNMAIPKNNPLIWDKMRQSSRHGQFHTETSETFDAYSHPYRTDRG